MSSPRAFVAAPSSAPEAGFSLIEVLAAAALLVTAITALAQLFITSTQSGVQARRVSESAIFAQQKLEELRAMTWSVDAAGHALSDLTSDTTMMPVTPGGTGLAPSPAMTLQQNTAGYVDYLDGAGSRLGGGAQSPAAAVYTRRWSVAPLPSDPDNTVVIQVLVTPLRSRPAVDTVLPGEARLVTVKTRKAQ